MSRDIKLTPMRPKVIIFDLDKTLFDHRHSLRCACNAIKQKFPVLQDFSVEELAEFYNEALKATYKKRRRRKISEEEAQMQRVRLFFRKLQLEEPSPETVAEFREVYKPAYRRSRQPTSGSIECLRCLREQGYTLAILTNGAIANQTDKAEQIGVLDLVDVLITSEEAHAKKPNIAAYRLIMQKLGYALHGATKAVMVGDSLDCDVEGAINAGIQPIWYSPLHDKRMITVSGTAVPVVTEMNQIPQVLKWFEVASGPLRQPESWSSEGWSYNATPSASTAS